MRQQRLTRSILTAAGDIQLFNIASVIICVSFIYCSEYRPTVATRAGRVARRDGARGSQSTTILT